MLGYLIKPSHNPPPPRDLPLLLLVAAGANPRRTVSSSSTIRREPVDVIVEEQKLHLLLEAGQVVTVEPVDKHQLLNSCRTISITGCRSS